jgi:hypothetical protein
MCAPPAVQVEALEFSAGDHVHVALFGRGIVREA